MMQKLGLKILYRENFNGGPENKKMEYPMSGDSGFDLRAATNPEGTYIIPPISPLLIPTGIRVAVPRGFEIQVRTRSGSVLKRGFFVANSPGTVDSGYRGEIGVICFNLTNGPIEIAPGERIAQAVLCPVFQAEFEEVDELDATERGTGGFHSTGVN